MHAHALEIPEDIKPQVDASLISDLERRIVVPCMRRSLPLLQKLPILIDERGVGAYAKTSRMR